MAIMHINPANTIRMLESELVALKDKATEVVSAIRGINRSRNQLLMVDGDEEPCYWQRKKWIDWMLELADELESEIAKNEGRE